MNKINNYEHPCFGRSCSECVTCRYDEPIPDSIPTHKRGVTIIPSCNECGYLIKQYASAGSLLFNATCGKHLIQSASTTRPRVIAHNVNKNMSIEVPDWCPKIADRPEFSQKPVQPKKPYTYDDYVEKRNRMKELPSVFDWKGIKDGDICVVPKLLRQERKVVLVKEKTDYVLKCVVLDDNLNPTSTYTNIYSNDIDVNFIVKYHKY